MPRKSSNYKRTDTWTITFEGEPGVGDDYQVDFYDISEIVKGLCIIPKYLDILGELQEKYEHYIITADIKYVTSEIGDLSDRFFLSILAERKDSKNFGLLLAEHEDGEKYPLIAVWPIDFYNDIKEDINNLHTVLNELVENPEKWKKVEMILPVEDIAIENEN